MFEKKMQLLLGSYAKCDCYCEGAYVTIELIETQVLTCAKQYKEFLEVEAGNCERWIAAEENVLFLMQLPRW